VIQAGSYTCEPDSTDAQDEQLPTEQLSRYDTYTTLFPVASLSMRSTGIRRVLSLVIVAAVLRACRVTVPHCMLSMSMSRQQHAMHSPSQNRQAHQLVQVGLYHAAIVLEGLGCT
jgi:hypothetical protein